MGAVDFGVLCNWKGLLKPSVLTFGPAKLRPWGFLSSLFLVMRQAGVQHGVWKNYWRLAPSTSMGAHGMECEGCRQLGNSKCIHSAYAQPPKINSESRNRTAGKALVCPVARLGLGLRTPERPLSTPEMIPE